MLLLIPLLFLSFLATPLRARPSEPLREWTIMDLAAADESEIRRPTISMFKRLERMESLRTNQEVNIIIQHDDVGPDDGNTYRIEYVEPHHRTKKLKFDNVPIAKFGELDSGNPLTLKRFILWTVTHYPARHYVLILSGHSWGQQGILQDFFVAGKQLEVSTMIKHYELRRVMEEVYTELETRSQADGIQYLQHKKFDALLVDACINGELDVALEHTVFTYVGATTIESPDNSFPFNQILDPFIREVNLHPARDNNILAHQMLEESLLKPFVHLYLKSHALGGQLALKEKQYDVVQAMVIRTEKLPRVAAALTHFVNSLPDEAKRAWARRQMHTIEMLMDSDENADLFQFAQNYAVYLENKGWTEARDSARALKNTLGYPDRDETLTPIRLHHSNSQGAWVHVQIDPLVKTRELSACLALQIFAATNALHTDIVPKFIDRKTGERVLATKIACNDLYSERVSDEQKKRRTKKRIEKPILNRAIPVDQFFGIKMEWPQGILPHLREFSAAEFEQEFESDDARQNTSDSETLNKRILSIWIPNTKSGKTMGRDAYLRLTPATHTIVVDYLAPDVDARTYIQRTKDFSSPKRDREMLETPTYVYWDNFGKDALYVAEAHSNGSLFKHGLGIYLQHDFKLDGIYNWGYRPVEKIPAQPFKNLDSYFEFIQKGKELEPYLVRGVDFYRQHQIDATGWPMNYLFYKAD